MNDISKKTNMPGATPGQAEGQWVMIFNVISGSGRDEVKKTYKVNKNRLVIGSALSSDIRIQQNAVSNVHAVVEMDSSGTAFIYDMASETGLFHNDKKILSSELKDGDEIKIGFAMVTFRKQLLQDAQAQIPAASIRSSGARKLFYNEKEDFRPLILEEERNVIQIFDYPSAGEQALQIVMYWGDVILDVQHIVDLDPVTIGESKKATFMVPGIHSEHSLVSFDGSSVTLQVTNDMEGVIRSGRQLIPLDQLGAQRFTLKQEDQAKIKFRDITFYISYSPLPPHLRRQRVLERDPFYTGIWFTSMGLTIALVGLITSMERPKPLEVVELPPQVATIIFKPVPPPPPPPVVKPKPQPVPEPEVKKEPPPPPPPKPKPKVEVKPKELPKEVKPPVPAPKVKTAPTEKPTPAVNQTKGQQAKTAGGDAGEGKRAKGPEGQKGEPNKPKAPVHQVQSKGNPNAPTNAKSETNNGKGNVETLFNDIGGNISKNLAASGKGASAAGAKLKGYGGFTTEGNGGLGNMGAGAGGGGETQSLSQGLGTKGIGEGASGKGVGAIGSGGNLLGTGHGRPVIEVGNASETIIMGGLDKGLIDEIIKRHMAQIRYCYVKELNGSAGKISGRVLTRFVIAGTGRVSQAGVESSSLGNSNVEKCLTGVLKNIVFPEPAGGGIVEVSYPFSFTPSVAGN